MLHAERRCDECIILKFIMVNAVMLNVVMLNVVAAISSTHSFHSFSVIDLVFTKFITNFLRSLL